MTKELACAGVDVAKNILDLAKNNSKETRQFRNDHKVLPSTMHHIARLKPAKIILETNGKYKIPLAEELQLNRLPLIIVNPHQVCDFALET